MHFSFISQPSNEATRTHSTELLCFIERASLWGRVHIDHRFRRVRFVTVDLHILLNTPICLYSPRIFINRTHYKPSISISSLYTVGSRDNSLLTFPLSHFHTIIFNQSFKQPLFLLYHGLFDPLLGRFFNNGLHLGMISSLWGIKELVDQVPVSNFCIQISKLFTFSLICLF